jgi:hypothetical protein
LDVGLGEYVTQLFNKYLGKFIKCVLALQNFINKHVANLENVQGTKKNEKDEFTRGEANTN